MKWFILFCRLYYHDTPPFRGLREFACTILRLCSKLPFVRSPNIPLYLYFDRLIVNTIVLDRNDFIEETCVFRCHLNSYPKRFSGFRRSFVIGGCRAAGGGTYVHDHKGIVPGVFYFYGCLLYSRFVESTEIDFCLCCFGCCFRYIFVWAVYQVFLVSTLHWMNLIFLLSSR